MNEGAERELAMRLAPQLRGIAGHLLGPTASRADIDDLAQEGYCALWKALRDFDGEVVDVWCRVVAANGMRKYLQYWSYALRDRSKVDYVGGTAELTDIENALGVAERVQLVQDAYHAGRVREAVDRLPPVAKEYVTRRFWRGETTTVLQREMSPSTWTRAKRRLGADLGDLVSPDAR